MLRTIAEWNPVTSVAEALRTLFGNPSALQSDGARWSDHPVAYSLIWIAAVAAVWVPLAVRADNRTIAA